MDEWLFQAVDPTLNMIDPALGWHGHLFINSSSPEAIATPDFIPSYTACVRERIGVCFRAHVTTLRC